MITAAARILVVGLLALGASAAVASDLLNQLDQLKPRSARSGGGTGLGLAEKPSDANPEAVVEWYYQAINHYSGLGDSDRVIALYREFIVFATDKAPHHTFMIRHLLAGELTAAGYHSEALALREENRQYFAKNPGLRIANLTSIARIKIHTFNDLAGARKVLAEAEADIKAAGEQSKEPEFVSLWLASLEWAKAAEARARGRHSLAIAYYRGAADRFARYATQMESLTKRYKYRDRKEGVIRSRNTILTELSHSLRHMGRAVEGEAVLREVLSDQIAQGARGSDVASTAAALGLTLMNQGRWAEAEKYQLQAVKIQSQSGLSASSLRHAQVLAGLVPTYIGQQQWQKAHDIYQQAVSKSVAADARTRRNFLWPEMTIVFLRLNKMQEALDHAKQVLEFEQQRYGQNGHRTRMARGFLAMALKASGDRQGAEAQFRESVSYILNPARDLSASGAAFLRLQIRHIVEDYLDFLSTVSIKEAKTESDIANLHELVFRNIELIRASSVHRAISGAAARFATTDKTLSDLVRQEQDLAISAADHQRAVGELFSGKMNVQQAQEIAAQMRRQIEELEDQRTKILDRIAKEFPDYSELVRPRLVSIADLRAALGPQEAYISVYPGLDKTYVLAIRTQGPVGLHVASTSEKDIGRSVAILRRSLDPGDVSLGKIPPFDFSVSYELYSTLFAPLDARLKGASVWTVSTSGALGTLPLTLLTTAPYRATPDARLLFAEYQRAPWLNRQVAIAYNPSAAATIALRKLPNGSAARRAFFGVGDPQFGEQVAQASSVTRQVKARADKAVVLRNMKIPRQEEKNVTAIQSADYAAQLARPSEGIEIAKEILAMADGAQSVDRSTSQRSMPASRAAEAVAIPDIPPLPDTRDEIVAIARSLGANPQQDALFGLEASRERLMSTPLHDRRILAFATHGLIPGDMPGLTQPALTMSYRKDPRESLLTLEDILRLKLDADWVVLSACNTGAADGLGGEAASGLGRGFFYAGSRALLLTHWPVESESAKRLVVEIFSRYAKNTSRAQAVREASQALIDSPGYLDPQTKKLLYSYAHPMFWAPYTLIGDSR